MLVLTRKVGNSIIISNNVDDQEIKIQVVQIKGRQVRLGIEAPKNNKIIREEVKLSSNSDKAFKPSNPSGFASM